MPNLCTALLLCASAAAQSLPEHVVALSRISRKAVQTLDRMGNFTCLETTDRWSRASSRVPLKLVDTLRVEVAHVGNRDLYAFPGARSFEDKTPAALAGTGAGASGTFVAHLRAVFRSGGAVIRFAGEETVRGQRVIRYDFSVPLLFHQLNMQVANWSGVASVKGSFWADPATDDVLRLEVQAAEIPPDVPISSFVTRIEYGGVQLGSERVWLPQRSDLRITYLSGREDNNRSEFTHCRQYTGESSIRFSDEAAVAAPLPPRVREIALPAGLTVPIELETEIDSKKTFVGDLLTARVTDDVTMRRAGVVIPKGAVVHGRLRLLYPGTEPVAHFVVGLEFIEVEFDGKRAPFYGSLAGTPSAAGLEVFLTGTAKSHKESATAGPLSASIEKVTWEQLRPPEVPGLSTFFMRGTSFRLPKGLRMRWRTAELGK